MDRARRAAVVLTALLTAAPVLAPAAGAAQPPPRLPATQINECSAEFYAGDERLGPHLLPRTGPVAWQLFGYSRTGNRPDAVFLQTYHDSADDWRHPPQDGYVLGYDGQPALWEVTLQRGDRVDRYDDESSRFLEPAGLAYGARSIPPSDLVGSPAAGCNYHLYEVLRPFDVAAGRILPWFFQRGGGVRYRLSGALVPGAPEPLTVAWLVANGYLARLA